MKIYQLLMVTFIASVSATVASAKLPTSVPTPTPVQIQIPQSQNVGPLPTSTPMAMVPNDRLPKATVASDRLPTAMIPASEDLFRATMSSPDDRVVMLRQQAAKLLDDIRIKNFRLMMEGLSGILSYTPDPSGATPVSEEMWNDIRHLVRQYYEIIAEIERYTGEHADADQRLQSRLDNLRNESPNYSMRISNHTDNVPLPQGPIGPQCHDETSFPITKILVDAGFDERGNPKREWHYDVVKQTRRVCQ